MQYTKTVLLLALISLLSACVSSYSSNRYAETVRAYAAAAAGVRLGMGEAEVARILAPTQRRLRALDQRPDERYVDGNALVLIRYYRSGWHEDGRLTDEEYTPYQFRNGRLPSIGWQGLQPRQLTVAL